MKNKKTKLIEFGVLTVDDGCRSTECFYEIDRASNGCRVLLSAKAFDTNFVFYKAFDSYLECISYLRKVSVDEVLNFLIINR